jgi:transposase
MLLKNYPLNKLEKRYRSEEDARVKERLQILICLREGKTQRVVSSMLRISVGKVPLWKKRFEQEGLEGLHDKEGRGRKAKLTEKQLQQLGAAIDVGVSMKDGYRRGYKTKDVKIYIRQSFGVKYTERHCRFLLHKEGFNLKVPRPRNKSRNQENVDDFKREFKKNSLVWIKT